MTPRIFSHIAGTTRYLAVIGYSAPDRPWVCLIDAATDQVDRPVPGQTVNRYAHLLQAADLHPEEVAHLTARIAGALFDWDAEQGLSYEATRPWPR